MSDRRPKVGVTLSFDFDRPPPIPHPPAPTPAPAAEAPAPVPVPDLPRAPTPAAPATPRILTVAQLGRALSRTLERSFPDEVWVEGEVTGARPAASGHVYFCLKDENEEAVLDVVLYRSQVTPRGRAMVKDGARLRVRGKPTYWSPRGRLQFIGDRVEQSGKGALLEALAKLKEKLAAEGLFASERKRPIPRDPRRIGVVTSKSGAVIHDICKVAFRRGGARILLAPAQVQGAGAAESVRRGLRLLQLVEDVDVIVVGRGGGSQEDLLAWNDEALVRDVAACRVPVVSAVGHEVDVTLVDFAADARAATPSQAAEMIVPDDAERRRLLADRTEHLRRAMRARIAEDRVGLGRLAQAFRDPRLLIASSQQHIDEHVARMERAVTARAARERELHARLSARLAAAHPKERIGRDRARATEMAARLAQAGLTAVRKEGEPARQLAHRLATAGARIVPGRRDPAMEHRLLAAGARLAETHRDRLGRLVGRLDAMSPLKVLGRGYAIVTHGDRAVRDVRELAAGERVQVRVDHGTFDAEVTALHPEDE